MVNIKSNNELYSKLIRNSIKIPTPIYRSNLNLASNIYSVEHCMNQISQISKIACQPPDIDFTLPIQRAIESINRSNFENINSVLDLMALFALDSINLLNNLDLTLKSFPTELAQNIYSFTDSLKEFCNENNIVDNDVENCVKSIDSTKEIFENNKLSKSDILNIINIVVTLLFFVYGLYSDTQNNISNEHMTKTIQQNTEANIKLTKELEKLNSNLKNLSSED